MNGDTFLLRRIALTRILASFKAPGFRLFYISNTFSAVDLNVRMAVHGWLVLELSNDSEFWIGIYALILGVGQILSAMVVGSIVDRYQRRNVLLIEGVVSAIIALGLALAIYLEVVTLGIAIGLAFVQGCVRAVRFTAANRFIYDLVGPRQLVNGASLWRISATPMMILGALLAGALIDWFGIWAAYGFLGVSQIISLPFVAMIRVKGPVERSNTNLMRQTVEGVRYAVRDQSLRTLFTISIVMEGLGFGFLVMIPVMAKTVLAVGGIGMGYLQAGVGAGMLIANLIMAARGDSENKPRVIFLNALLVGFALIAFALSRSLPLSILLAAAIMAFLNAYDITLGSLMQLVAPPNLRGRAVSLYSMAVSFTALGGFVMGAAGSVVGVPITLAVAGAGVVVNSLLRRSALMRIKEQRHQPTIEPAPVNAASDDSN